GPGRDHRDDAAADRGGGGLGAAAGDVGEAGLIPRSGERKRQALPMTRRRGATNDTEEKEEESKETLRADTLVPLRYPQDAQGDPTRTARRTARPPSPTGKLRAGGRRAS